AEEGCDVILVARSAADLDAARQGIAAAGNVGVVTHALDLSQSASVDRLCALHADIDILVNNAGAIPAGRLDEINEPRWRQAWDLKVFGYINMCRAFYAAMRERGRGVIVNVLGAAGERLDAEYIAGSSGNAGLMAFTKALGASAPDHNLRVVGINPGAIATERMVTMMRKKAQDRFGDAERWADLVKPLPFGRAGAPEEIAAMVAYLASDRAAYITGSIVTIDGGVSNRGVVF
ncbi:MAG: short-chain dehydrogenase/reductase, partial [Pseudomonadota bacterium]|nr:short-chain dehydrogenase/reductase [Pseudomonadota bacterium]